MNNQTEVRRAKFEAWFAESGMTKFKETAYAAWEEAIDSVVVELPNPESMKFCPATSGDYDAGFDHGQSQARADFIAAIHAAGVKTK